MFLLLAALYLPLVLLPLPVSSSCDLTLVEDDVATLLAGKEILGDLSNELADWSSNNVSQACCWTGVTCLSVSFLSDSVPRVYKLNLTGIGLSGTLPAVLGNLTALTSVDFSSNSLSGSIPTEWSKLSSLGSLVLSRNRLSGNLGPLPKLVNIKSIYLSDNSFEGAMDDLPLTNLTQLRFLDLSYNLFTGKFPRWVTNLRKLSGIYLDHNPNLSVSTLPDQNSWPILFEARFSSMNLVGPIPVHLAQPSLLTLDLSQNNLNGTIPKEFGIFGQNIKSFQSYYPDVSISLQSNQLSGNISELPVMPFVENLNLSSNVLTGKFPSNTSWQSLKVLDISRNNVSFDVHDLNLMPLLTELHLSDTLVNKTLPLIANWSSLQTIDLSKNKITGEILLNFFDRAKTLKDLYLSNNELTGGIPETLFALPELRSLKLRGNQLSDLPESFADIPVTQFLQILDLGDNSFNSFPDSFDSFSRLRELYLDKNNLSGAIPKFLGSTSFLQILDLSNNPFTSQIPPSFGEDGFEFDQILEIFKSKSFLALTNLNMTKCGLLGRIPPNLGTLTRLSSLNLAENNLEGSIPDLSRTSLSSLNLSNNKLEGEIPEFLGSLPLTFLNLSHNNFSGYLPQSIFNSSFALYLTDCDSYLPGNENLLVNCTDGKIQNHPWPPPSLPSSLASGLKLYQIILIIVAALFLVAVVMLGAYGRYRSRRKKASFLSMKVKEHYVKAIPLRTIRELTEAFSDAHLLGGGSFGLVYKGVTKSGQIWAVKRTKRVSVQSLEVFQNEVETISRMNHKNLVKLLGFCDEDSEQILVYEFVPNGTLRAALHPSPDSEFHPLTFEQRLEIALGAAEGLRYLHTQAKPTIIHRDVKSENILLDTNFQAKVSDFGLLKGNDEEVAANARTQVAGTHGYMDPEYYTNFRVTPKSDVYSFGVVLLELITGRDALILEEDRAEEEDDRQSWTSLAAWALERLRSSLGLLAIVDPGLDSNFPLEAMEHMASIAASCLQKVSKYRPDMADVESQLRLLKWKLSGIEGIPPDMQQADAPVAEFPTLKLGSNSSNANSSIYRPVPKGSFISGR